MSLGMPRRWRRPIALLSTLFLLAHALIPQGYMPSRTGAAPLALCTGQGLVLRNPGAAKHPSTPHGSTVCAFAAAALQGGLPDAPAVTPAPPVARVLNALGPEPARATPSGPLRAQSPRGPPLPFS